MTCKDCIHCDVCPQDILSTDLHPYIDFSVRDDVEESCDDFKDKSRFIELPCAIGDYCIYKNDIWYIDKILYLGINVFFTSLINIASHRFTRAPVEEIEFISKDIEEAEKKLEELNANAKN